MHNNRYHASHVFHVTGIGFILIASLCFAAVGYGSWLPKLEQTLDSRRSHMTMVLAEAVGDDVRRGNTVLAQTRLSRFAGLDGIVSATLVVPQDSGTITQGDRASFASPILSGGPDSEALAHLHVVFDKTEERLVDRAIAMLLLTIILTASALFLSINWIGRRLLIAPLDEVARQVRESRNLARITSPSIAPKEVRELVEAHNERVLTIANLHAERAELRQASAVAQLTAMLAHDVRKPFSILRMGLGMLQRIEGNPASRTAVARITAEVDRAVCSVEGLIADVMEINSPQLRPSCESICPAFLLDSALKDIFRVYPEANVEIDYDLTHAHAVKVHVAKVGRVLSNILANGLQAMEFKGQIWLKTCERDHFVEFCLGNSGSYIAESDLPNLFDTFYTKGKKRGTGLGLAIAHKIVTSHGGKIWCSSAISPEHPNGMVEFYFTLPIDPNHRRAGTVELPRSSREVACDLFAHIPGETVDVSVGNTLSRASSPAGSPTRQTSMTHKPVVVVDDDPFVLDIWEDTLGSASIQCFSAPSELLDAIRIGSVLVEKTAVVVTDLHFSESEKMSGLDLARKLSTLGFARIIAATDAEISGDDREVFADVIAKSELNGTFDPTRILRSDWRMDGRGDGGVEYDS